MGEEREAKLHAPQGFRLPDLSRAADGVTAGPPRRRTMLAVYHDTADLALARAGVTLRHRTGEDGRPWTLKFAGTESAGQLTRRELSFEGSPGTVPEEAADLVRAHTRGRPLLPVATLRQLRVARELFDAAGSVVVEVADDRVTAYSGAAEVARFRELEVELKSTDGATTLAAVVERLVRAGAVAGAPLPKLIRALGPAAQAPPDIVVGEVGRRTEMREFVRHIIAGSAEKIIVTDPALRLGAEIADVHAFRVATRRLRSDLRTFRPLLDPVWAATLRAELAWLADFVGALRDHDVLDLHLREQLAAMEPDDAQTAAPLLDLLVDQRASARSAMLDALRSPRYDTLLESLVAASSQPKFAGAADVELPARTVTSALVRQAWRTLRREVRAAGDDPTDQQLHAIRIVAKRARYAAEAAAHLFGKKATRFAAAVEDLQTVLGDHHDASVAEEWLRASAALAPRSGVAAGLLIGGQQRARARLRARWRKVWTRASRPGLRGWL